MRSWPFCRTNICRSFSVHKVFGSYASTVTAGRLMNPRLIELDTVIRNCRLCEPILSIWPDDPPKSHAPVQPRPILSQPSQAAILLVGQAPGLTEYRSGRPFSGGAGEGIR